MQARPSTFGQKGSLVKTVQMVSIEDRSTEMASCANQSTN